MPRHEAEWSVRDVPPEAEARLAAAIERAIEAELTKAGIPQIAVRREIVPSMNEHLERLRGPAGERHMTRTGRVVNRFAPGPEDWDLEALAWSQANLCRYGGELFARPDADGVLRTHAFYSTGEHQLHAARAVEILHGHLPAPVRARLRLYALVHDFVETRLSDIISVIKKMIRDAKIYELALEASLYGSIGLEPHLPAEVDAIDKRLVVNEGPVMFPGTDAAFWRERTNGRAAIPGLVIPDPRFVATVEIAPGQRRPGLGAEMSFWSFPPLVASALVDEIRGARAAMARAA